MALTKATQAVIAVDICTTDTAQTITGVKTFTNAISAPNIPAANMVTTDTAQTITGVKTFTSAISAPNIPAANMVTTDTAQTITGVKTISNDTLINGLTVGKGGGNIASNTASGASALAANTTGTANTAVGASSLNVNTTGASNTAVGASALQANTTGIQNIAVGVNALQSNTTGNYNTASGTSALQANTTGASNTAVGANALQSNTTGDFNTATGVNALFDNTTGINNTAIGYGALFDNTVATANTAVGVTSLQFNTTGDFNTAVGYNALGVTTTGSNNTAIGYSSLNISNYTNTTGLGYNTDVTGSNQVQLGNSATTTYAYGAVQNRSDIRDKADIRDTTLGLEFVNALRPVDFKWDMREDYRAKAPKAPEQDATESEKAAYKVAKDKWLEDVKLANITHDGSKKRSRFHHGLIAQEVKAVLDAKGIDFGGFQDHSVKGGDDVLSIGYEELIAPMLKAIQELSAKVAELEAK